MLISANYTPHFKVGIEADESASNAKYYVIVDVIALAEKRYGKEFAEWLEKDKDEIELLNDLTKKKGVVLMYGPGFDVPHGTVRISLANLEKDDYAEIARRLFELLNEYHSTNFQKKYLPPAFMSTLRSIANVLYRT